MALKGENKKEENIKEENMKEELVVMFEIPEMFITSNDRGEYDIASDFPYDKAVKYIKDFSKTYYGIDVNVSEDELVAVQCDKNPLKWTITHKWIDAPNYEELTKSIMNIGLVRGPTPIMLQKPPSGEWNNMKNDHLNLLNIYEKIRLRPTRKDIFKSMIKSVKNHLIMMK